MSIPIFNFRKPKPEKKGNKLILFANQKGGVGKSTNCVMFGNYLVDIGIQLSMIDADSQFSIKKKHDQDMEQFPNLPEKYHVYPFDELDSEEATKQLLKEMRQEEFDFIIDSPGSLSKQGMVQLLLGVDAIIVPFQYEKTCLNSMNTFINLNVDICNSVGRDKLTPMYFVPNMYHKNWGRKDELDDDKVVEAKLNTIGTVTPKVPSTAEIRRYNTLFTTQQQRELTSPCYDFLYERIYKEIRNAA